MSTWVIILALGQALFNKELSGRLRLFCIILSGVLFSISFGGITWLSGWLPSLVGVGILAFLRSRKGFVLLLIGVALIAVLNLESWEGVINAEDAESGVTRSEAWDRVFDLIGDHLLFGSGPAGYHFYFTVYIGGFYQLSHNNYVDILAQTGVVGFTFFAWMWLAIGWMVLRTYRSVPRQGFRHGLAGSLFAAYFISVVSMMLGDWITPFPYTQTLAGIDYTIWHWMMAGLAVALFYEAKQTPVLSQPTIP
jgi:O-antigen ligase